jgi:hypothetical protein
MSNAAGALFVIRCSHFLRLMSVSALNECFVFSPIHCKLRRFLAERSSCARLLFRS